MKTLFSVIAAAAVFGIAAPTSAKAECQGQTRIVGYTAYGAPIVSVYQIVGYDGYGRPIGQWVTQVPQANCGYGGVPRPVIVQPSISFGFGGYNRGCNTGYGYPQGPSHHHHGFRR